MSPRWLHWPAASGSLIDYQINADLVASTATRYNLTNVVEAGNVGDFSPGASQPFRYITGVNDVVRFIFNYDGSMTAADMSNATLANVTDGILFSPTSVTFGDIGGTSMQVNFNGSGSGAGSTADVFWQTLAAGHEIQLVLEYA
jgi:hypothetical protein